MSKLRDKSGQMTIEFVVAFPVMIAIAFITVNALLFFSEVSAFDRELRFQASVYETSLGYGENIGTGEGKIRSALESQFSRDYLQTMVSCGGVSGGLVKVEGTLLFTPTLFGLGDLSSVFGVAFPPLTHSCSLVVDNYKPGVLL